MGPLRPVSVERRPSSLRRLEPLRLRGGGGGQTRERNAQLLNRSRPRWEREWKVTGACCPSLAGSTRTENNETSAADLMSLKPEVLAELDESAMSTCAKERVAMIGKMMERSTRGAPRSSPRRTRLS